MSPLSSVLFKELCYWGVIESFHRKPFWKAFKVKIWSRIKLWKFSQVLLLNYILSICVIRLAFCSFLMNLIWFPFIGPAYRDKLVSEVVFLYFLCSIVDHVHIWRAYLETFIPFTAIAKEKSNLYNTWLDSFSCWSGVNSQFLLESGA